MPLAPLAAIFQLIAEDARRATARHDEETFNKLTALVIALEHAYPKEMAALREEGLPREEIGR